jgi:hypothetical protein
MVGEERPEHAAHVLGPLRSAAVIVPCAKTPLNVPDMNPGHDEIGPGGVDSTATQAASPPLATVLGFGSSQTPMSILGERWM